ncbi:hypothetical protein ITK37_004529 [Salmonella enterica]|nr:hypothetical protein [Salmonella enterica]
MKKLPCCINYSAGDFTAMYTHGMWDMLSDVSEDAYLNCISSYLDS